MARLVSDALDECSRMLVNHTGWAYLDHMTVAEQLEVITTYKDVSLTGKYIVVVFERNEMREKHFKRCEELGLNQDEEVTFAARIVDENEFDQSDQSFNKEEMEEEWLENNP